jgi:hypothetical protein
MPQSQQISSSVPAESKPTNRSVRGQNGPLQSGLKRALSTYQSLFNWIDEKTGIQDDPKTRSYKGLIVHIFGRVATAMLMLALNP